MHRSRYQSLTVKRKLEIIDLSKKHNQGKGRKRLLLSCPFLPWTCSSEWFSRWKKRHNIKYRSICGENASVDQSVCEDWKQSTLGRCCMLRKYLGDSNFPITNKGRFSVPSMFAQTSTVILSLLFFQPVQVSLAAACVLSGSSCQNRPVSSVLNMPLASYCCRTG